MFEILSLTTLATAFIGSSLAAAWDLKTTEIPDEISYIMIAVALVAYGAQSLLTWNYWPLVNSAIVGLGFLGFGFLMYYLGQWGGGDVKILAAIGFLLPAAPAFLGVRLLLPFPLSYIINVFFVGAAYMLAYAAALAAMNRKIMQEFNRDMKASSRLLLVASVALFAAFFALGFYLTKSLHLYMEIWSIVTNSLLPLSLTLALFIVWKFARAVENVGFKKRISVRELKVGDVLKENKLWEGITEKELHVIKHSKQKYVWIKSGVRFAPAFPLALLLTIYFGDAVFLFVKFFV